MVNELREKLSDLELSFYKRQLSLLGQDNQLKLKNSKVCIIGLGGLGSLASLYLSLAGIGKLLLVDDDIVNYSDLHRQILYTINDVGKKKVEVAYRRITSHNPLIKVDIIDEKINEDNVYQIIKDCNIVVDCLDNWTSRFILNSACIKLKKPLVHGAVQGFQGQLLIVIPKVTPCLRCIFTRVLEKKDIPIVNSTVGVIASLQVNEIIKLLTNMGKPLLNRLLIYDGYMLRFYISQVNRNPNCIVCS